MFTADALGYTPLHYAASYGHKMAVQMVMWGGGGGRVAMVLITYRK